MTLSSSNGHASNSAAVLAVIILFGIVVAVTTTALYLKTLQEKKMSQVSTVYIITYDVWDTNPRPRRCIQRICIPL